MYSLNSGATDNMNTMTTPAEQTIAELVLVGFGAVAAFRLIRWVAEAPITPDPWDGEIDEATNREDAIPLCHHCLTPQEHNGWFCPECGATVGPYVNYLPYVYIFSEGELLRAGVNEPFRRSPILLPGFILFSVFMHSFFAPIYLYFMLKNMQRTES
jgi:hypothetical protein